jgi:hypothetical protein
MRYILASVILIVVGASSPASGAEVSPPPVPLSEWLSERVAFVGIGQVSALTVDPATGYASFTLTLVEAWKGTAARTVTFDPWPFPHGGLSEGGRMVYYAFNRKFTHTKAPVYTSPEPIFRSGGRDCFVFAYATQAIPPEHTIAISYRGQAKERGLAPILLLSEFRAAVLASAK